MRFSIVAIGQRMPTWVVSGWSEYARRFPRGFALDLREISAIKRPRNADIESIRRRECEALLDAVPETSLVIALDENGQQWSTPELSGQMEEWMKNGRDVSFLIGGADGLSAPASNRLRSAGRWAV